MRKKGKMRSEVLQIYEQQLMWVLNEKVKKP